MYVKQVSQPVYHICLNGAELVLLGAICGNILGPCNHPIRKFGNALYDQIANMVEGDANKFVARQHGITHNMEVE